MVADLMGGDDDDAYGDEYGDYGDETGTTTATGAAKIVRPENNLDFM
jgi:hypothetical protein